MSTSIDIVRTNKNLVFFKCQQGQSSPLHTYKEACYNHKLLEHSVHQQCQLGLSFLMIKEFLTWVPNLELVSRFKLFLLYFRCLSTLVSTFFMAVRWSTLHWRSGSISCIHVCKWWIAKCWSQKKFTSMGCQFIKDWYEISTQLCIAIWCRLPFLSIPKWEKCFLFLFELSLFLHLFI